MNEFGTLPFYADQLEDRGIGSVVGSQLFKRIANCLEAFAFACRLGTETEMLNY